jgi:hypothetical protein
LQVKPTVSGVNYVQVNGNTTGNGVNIQAEGSDADVALSIRAKGTFNIPFFTGGGTQTVVSNTASAVNYLGLTGAATGNAPTISAQGSDANVNLVLTGKGTGVVALGGSTVANSAAQFVPTTSSVNYIQFQGATTGVSPSFVSTGTDAAVGFFLSTKGNANVNFGTNSFGNFSFIIKNVASAVNYLTTTGAATGNAPTFSAEGSDANIGLTFLTKNSGGIGIGNAAAAGRTLDVSKNITGALSGYGINQRGQVQTDVTADAASYRSVSNTITGFTLPTYNHFFAVQGTLSGTVSNQFGFVAESSLTGATNNYGFYGNIAAATGRYNFYASGTAINVFVGNTTIGGTVGTQSLQVNNVASAVNYVQAQGAVTTGSPIISVDGTDANVALSLRSKGTYNIGCQTSGGAYIADFAPSTTGFGVNGARLTGAGTGNPPELSAQGSDTNIDLLLRAKGTGVVALGGTTTANSSLQVQPIASAVNYIQIAGTPTGGAINFQAKGADANIGVDFATKGTGIFRFYTQTYSVQQLRITDTPSAVNFFDITGAITGGAPEFIARGSDTNINIKLTTKGTGTVQFGTYTAGVVAQAGYITITDAGGTSRRLLVG